MVGNSQLLLSFLFTFTKGMISSLQDINTFFKASQLLFSQTTDTLQTKIHHVLAHLLRWDKRIINSASLKKITLLNNSQQMYFNLLLICLRVYLLKWEEGNLLTFFLNIQMSVLQLRFHSKYLLTKDSPPLLTEIDNQFDYSIVNRLLWVLRL